MHSFKITITFLNGTYHGSADGGEPEWPPSPMRLFQALVSAASSAHGDPLPDDTAGALDWLAGQSPPIIETPRFHEASLYRTSVPNNAMDVCARSWRRGNYDSKDAQPSTHKAMKTIQPVVLEADDPVQQRVCYAWEIDAGNDETVSAVNVLADLASRLACVGWGVDLVAGHGELVDVTDESSSTTAAIRWEPSMRFGRKLRVANGHSLKALQRRHDAFLNRVTSAGLALVPAIPPTAFDTMGYGRAWEVRMLPFAAFSLIDPDGSRFKHFQATQGSKVVGMLRCATREAAEAAGWEPEKIARIVLGHGEKNGERHQPVGLDRFVFAPLPSLEPRQKHGRAEHIGMIRRVLVYAPTDGHQEEINWLRRSLSGVELIAEGDRQPIAIVSAIPESEKVVRQYVPQEGASVWSTVTPLVLPGNYIRKQDIRRLRDSTDAELKRQLWQKRDARIDSLIRKAIMQAGFSTIMAEHARLDWRNASFWPGGADCGQFFVPQHLRKFPLLYVRVRWCDPNGQAVKIPGPVLLGGGRFYGLGLFAAEQEPEGKHETTR